MMRSCDGGTAACRVRALPPELQRIAFFLLLFFCRRCFNPKRRRLLNFFLSPTDTSPPFLLPPRAVFVYDLASGWAAS